MVHAPLLPVYRRNDVTMVRGEGAYLWDDSGRSYLDFASGIATCSLGHAHPALVATLTSQSEQLWHCANLFYNQPLIDFSRALVEAVDFADQVFFCSSGTEAVEGMIKFIRHYHFARGDVNRTRIIVADGAFHGRTMGALSACSNPASKLGFGTLLDGFDVVAFNDAHALEAAITPDTAAIMLETIQGEGGVRVHSADYLRKAREIATKYGVLLCLDEIQCGYGRTGQLYAYEAAGIAPDMMSSAKGIGSGFPLAAVLLSNKASEGLKAGMHGSTYGGNPLAMAVGLATLKVVQSEGFLYAVTQVGGALKAGLFELTQDFPMLYESVRGVGMMLGLQFVNPDIKHEYTARLRTEGLLVAPSVSDVVRILPPLIAREQEVNEALSILRLVSAKLCQL